MMFKRSIVVFSFLFFQSCSSFNTKQNQLHEAIVDGDYLQANKILDKGCKSERNGRNKLLYYMDRGIVAYLNHDYEKSNEFFNLADNIHEDQTSGVGDILIKYTVNPSLTTYLGEDHEIFFIHYFKTLNYLALGQNDEALVECRRLNTELEVLSDKYKDQKDVYCKDAFAHTLMGIVYQSSHDYNNAFVAYRNAVEIFEDPDYQNMFHVLMPKQLQKDIIFVAHKLSDHANVTYYQKKFDLQDYDHSDEGKDCGDLICFWNNGVCPEKENFTITFTLGRIGDLITFTNLELGLFFTFPIPSDDVFDLQILNVAFPRYKRSFSVIERGFIKIDGKDYELEKLENVNKVALKTLSERMNYEMGQMLLRFALKKSSEMALRKTNEYTGMALGLFNAITEEADIRHWKNLPFEISYSRVKLPEGKYSVQLIPNFNDRVTYDIFRKFEKEKSEGKEILIKENKTTFLQFNTLFGSN